MSAILLLLAILSIATLASRKGEDGQFLSIVSVPLLLGTGYLLSHHGLGLISQNSHSDLQTALRLACSWLAFLVGLRAAPFNRSSKYWIKVAQVSFLTLFTWLLVSLVGALTLFILKTQDFILLRELSFLQLFGVSLLLGGILSGSGYEKAAPKILSHHVDDEYFIHFLARHDEIIAVIAILLAIFLWPIDKSIAPIYTQAYVPVFVIFGIAFSVALAQLFLNTNNTNNTAKSFMTLMGLFIFSSGICKSTFLPEALIAFCAGLLLANSKQARLYFDHGILKSEVPLRLAVFLLVGLELEFSWLALLSALLLTIIRLGVKIVERWLLNGERSSFPLYSFLSSSSLAIPLVYSFVASRPTTPMLSFLLTTVCISVSLSDIFTFYRWQRPNLRRLILKSKVRKRQKNRAA